MTALLALTGASGFIGGHVAQAAVDAGWRVRVLARRPPSQPPLSVLPVDIVVGDLDDRTALRALVRDATAVVHLAGLVKARSRQEFFETNATGVATLLDAVLAHDNAPRFLLMSSLAAREPHLSAYAASKRAGEQVLAERATALPWTVMRPAVVYGPRDLHTLAFFRAIARGIGPLLAPEAARVSCVHVADLADAVLALLGAGESTYRRTYEIHDGQQGGYSWRGLIDAAAAHLGTRPRIVRVPAPLLTTAARASQVVGRVTGTTAMLSPDKVREIRHLDWACQDRRLVEASQWQPRVPVAAGFATTIDWYRHARWL